MNNKKLNIESKGGFFHRRKNDRPTKADLQGLKKYYHNPTAQQSLDLEGGAYHG